MYKHLVSCLIVALLNCNVSLLRIVNIIGSYLVLPAYAVSHLLQLFSAQLLRWWINNLAYSHVAIVLIFAISRLAL